MNDRMNDLAIYTCPILWNTSFKNWESTIVSLDFKKKETNSYFLAYNSFSIWNAFFPLFWNFITNVAEILLILNKPKYLAFVRGEGWLLLKSCAQQETGIDVVIATVES